MEVDLGKRWAMELNSENAGQNGLRKNLIFSSNILTVFISKPNGQTTWLEVSWHHVEDWLPESLQ